MSVEAAQKTVNYWDCGIHLHKKKRVAARCQQRTEQRARKAANLVQQVQEAAGEQVLAE